MTRRGGASEAHQAVVGGEKRAPLSTAASHVPIVTRRV
jgi:hypothetical protein